MEGADGVTVTVGVDPSVTVTLPVPVHPFASVPFTVYDIDALLTVACTVDPVTVFRPLYGFHTYDTAPLTLNVVVPGLHKVTAVGFIVNLGSGFTFTNTVFDELGQAATEPVIV